MKVYLTRYYNYARILNADNLIKCNKGENFFVYCIEQYDDYTIRLMQNYEVMHTTRTKKK